MVEIPSRFTCYIPCGGDLHLTHRAVASLADELANDYPYASIVVINNTEGPIEVPGADDIVDMPVRLLHGQSINYMIRDAAARREPFCMSLHNDAKLYPGAVKELLDKWAEIQYTNTRWGAITLGHNNGDAFVLWNPRFFIDENVWHLPFLHPFYYLDNTMYRMMELRGYEIIHTENDLILHEGSHTIRNDPVWRRINDICFKHHGSIYAELWGGYPGSETINDPTARGIYPLPH